MDKAIAKCGMLTTKEGVLRKKKRSVSRWYVLTNQGVFFEAKDAWAPCESLKPCIHFNGNAEITMETSGSASPGDARHVIKIDIKEKKRPPMEFGASSDSDIMSWYKALQDVIGLVRAINGDETYAPPTSTTGGKLGDERWYTEGAGRIALYRRLYQLQATKREIASVPATTTEEQGETNTCVEERTATLTPELEQRDEEARTIKGENTSLAATVEEQMETIRCLEERNAALSTELQKLNDEQDGEARTIKTENTSLAATAKEQMETNRCLEERNAALTTELHKINDEQEEEARTIKTENTSLAARVEEQMETIRCLEERNAALTTELHKINDEQEEEARTIKTENTSLAARVEEQMETNRCLEEKNAALTTELQKLNDEQEEEVRTFKTENTSLAARVEEQMETNRCLEERNAALTTELQKRNKERDKDEEVRRIQRENASLTAAMEAQVEFGRSLEVKNAILTRELEKANRERSYQVWRSEQKISSLEKEAETSRSLKDRNAHLSAELDEKLETIRGLQEKTAHLSAELDEKLETIRGLQEKTAHLSTRLVKKAETITSMKERNAHLLTVLRIRGVQLDEHTSRLSRLEAELNNTRTSVGSLASLPERSRQTLASLAGSLESVLEECVICCDPLLSGIGAPSFGVTSYSCGCSRSGHVRALHVNCIVSMSNLNCPLCSEEMVLIAPSLMTSTAVRSFTVRKRS